MKTSTLEKPVVAEMNHLPAAVSTEFLKLARDFVVFPPDFDNDQGLTIRDDILMLTRKPLPKELRNKLIEAGIIVDNSVYLANGNRGVVEDHLMYLTAGVAEDNAMFRSAVVVRDESMVMTMTEPQEAIIEDNYIYLYRKPNSHSLQHGFTPYIVVTGAVARLMENAKAGIIISDEVILRSRPHGTMVAMPVHHFAPCKGPQTLFLLAIQGNRASKPKVARLRAKFHRQGRIESLSWTNAANKKVGLPKFEEMWISSGSPDSFNRMVTIYLDGDAWLTVNQWDVDCWTRTLGV